MTCHAGHTTCRFADFPPWERLSCKLSGTDKQVNWAKTIREEWVQRQNWRQIFEEGGEAYNSYNVALVLAASHRRWREAAAWIAAHRAGDLDRQLRTLADQIFGAHTHLSDDGEE